MKLPAIDPRRLSSGSGDVPPLATTSVTRPLGEPLQLSLEPSVLVGPSHMSSNRRGSDGSSPPNSMNGSGGQRKTSPRIRGARKHSTSGGRRKIYVADSPNGSGSRNKADNLAERRKVLNRNHSDVNLLVDAFHGKVRKQSFISARGSLFKEHSLEDFFDNNDLEVGLDNLGKLVNRRKASRPNFADFHLGDSWHEKTFPTSDMITVGAIWLGAFFVCQALALISSVVLQVGDAVVYSITTGLTLGVFLKQLHLVQQERSQCRASAGVLFNVGIGVYWICMDVLGMYLGDLMFLWVQPIGYLCFQVKYARMATVAHGVLVFILPLIFGFTRGEARSTIGLQLGKATLYVTILGMVCDIALHQYNERMSLFEKLFSTNEKMINCGRKLTEQYKSKKMLLKKLLPGHIEKTLAGKAKMEQQDAIVGISDTYHDVTILFCDLVGFTTWCSDLSPDELVELLSDLFSVFDMLSEKYGIEKIKTIGDCYMAAGGIPIPRANHAEKIVMMAMDMMDAVGKFNRPNTDIPIVARIGIHSGSLIAAVIGIKKLSYDVFGDTVNMASRMESSGIPGRIQVSQATYDQIRHKFDCEKRSDVKVKGKGNVDWYLVNGLVSDNQGGNDNYHAKHGSPGNRSPCKASLTSHRSLELDAFRMLATKHKTSRMHMSDFQLLESTPEFKRSASGGML